MCVIAICENAKGRPTEEALEAMWDANSDGAGIAWQEKKRVRFKKGLGWEEVRDLALTVPVPFVVHFRISSVGPVTGALTHPFPINASASLEQNGTAERVLFHNGTWTDWQKEGRLAVFNSGAKLPTGRWSDTRMMALIAHYYGEGILDLIGEKVVTFGAGGLKDINVYGRPWSIFNKDNMNMLVSNMFWEGRYETIKRAKAAVQNALILAPSSNPPQAEQTEAQRVHGPVWQDQQRTATAGPEVPATGRPFTKPLSFFEEKHQRGELSAHALERIKEAFARQSSTVTTQSSQANTLAGPRSNMIN